MTVETAPRGGRGPDGAGGGRRRGPQLVFEVVRTERIAAHLTRVVLGGSAFEQFIGNADPDKLAATDKYVKILFAKPELGLTPPYDLDALRERLDRDDLPVRRTYTVRAVDPVARTIAIDFVVHGDEGVAGPWAASASPGDLLAMNGPGGQYAPDADASFHYFFADDSALPAVAAALESLPADAAGLALLEVDGEADQLELTRPDGVEVRWVHRAHPDGSGDIPGAALVRAARGLPAPASDRVEVFAHGEREAMKSLRGLLVDEWRRERRSLSLSAYWAWGRSEDRFQSEKREPIGRIFEE